jgi:hypothetical protein
MHFTCITCGRWRSRLSLFERRRRRDVPIQPRFDSNLLGNDRAGLNGSWSSKYLLGQQQSNDYFLQWGWWVQSAKWEERVGRASFLAPGDVKIVFKHFIFAISIGDALRNKLLKKEKVFWLWVYMLLLFEIYFWYILNFLKIKKLHVDLYILHAHKDVLRKKTSRVAYVIRKKSMVK